jgi:cell division protease FtsH
MAEFSEALDRVIAGPERRSRIITEEEKEVIAYHEGGHAVVQRVLPKCDAVSKVTIVSRGMALGYTMSLPAEDRYLHSKSEFEDKIAGMLGGHVAEHIVFGDTTTGATNDLEKATNLARAMVTQYGMSEKLGPLTFGKKEEMIFLGREISEQRNYSDEVAAKIDEEVRGIIDRAYDRAKDALTAQRAVLDRLAGLLVEKETIEGEEFESLFTGILLPRSKTSTPRRFGEAQPEGGETPVEEGEAPSGDGHRRRRGPAPQPA